MPVYSKCSNCGRKILQGSRCECRKERYKKYDKNVRSSEDNKRYVKFYNSKEWKVISYYIKIKYNGLCLMCLIKYKELKPSDVIHHINEIKECWDERTDKENLIPLCHSCHNGVHSHYDREIKEELNEILKKYRIIYGGA